MHLCFGIRHRAAEEFFVSYAKDEMKVIIIIKSDCTHTQQVSSLLTALPACMRPAVLSACLLFSKLPHKGTTALVEIMAGEYHHLFYSSYYYLFGVY